MTKKKKQLKKQSNKKHVIAYTPTEAANLLAGGYLNYPLHRILTLAKSEMDIKNRLYEFLAYKGLYDEYANSNWYEEYRKM